MKDFKFISKRRAAEFLEVSLGTLRNWTRYGIIEEVDGKYLFSDIEELYGGICNGSIDRLKSRANKNFNSTSFLPEEYLVNKNNKVIILALVTFLVNNGLSFNDFLFCFALKSFIDSGDFDESYMDSLIVFEPSHFKRKCVRAYLFELFNEIEEDSSVFEYEVFNFLLKKFVYPEKEDVVGLVYQSLLKQGEKAKSGAYYTPKEIVDFQLGELLGGEADLTGKSFVDPCCGCGQYLKGFSRFTKNPTDIYGFDIDKNSVMASRLMLLLEYRDIDFTPNIFNINSINNSKNFSGTFDYVITNPPWSSRLGKQDIFSDFVKLSIEMLDEKGKFSLVLPDSLTNVKKHLETRKIILQNCKIISIAILGRRFKNVLSKVIILDAEKNLTVAKKSTNNIKIKKLENKKSLEVTDSHKIKQSHFKNEKSLNFLTNISNRELENFSKLFQREYSTLKNNAEWGLGIVTGDNKKYIFKNSDKNSLPKNRKNLQQIITGKEIKKYKILPLQKSINFLPGKFQQVASLELYKNPQKLVYKFISSDLTFALDTHSTLTLNSANILIPKLPHQTTKTTLAFLNSQILNDFYKKNFSTIKILRSNLEQLPFPKLSKSEIASIEKLVDSILALEDGNSKNSEKENLKTELEDRKVELENLIRKIYGLI